MKATDSDLQDEKEEYLIADSEKILSISHALSDVQLGALSSSDESERWNYDWSDDFNDDDDDNNDDDDYDLYDCDDNSESSKDYVMCNLNNCDYCELCSY